MRDKIVGILGGMGPEATIDLFARIVKETKAKSDEDHLRIIVDNNPKMPSRQGAILNGTENPGPAMGETAKNLEKAGADFIIIGANTAHYFYDDVKSAVEIPVLHIIDEAVIETKQVIPDVKKVGVLCTTAAMKTKLYHKSLEKFSIEVVEVPQDIQELVQKSIFSFKYNGLTEDNVGMMLKSINYLIDNGADALIMGCTEIPLILKNQNIDVPMINPNKVIAKVAVQFAQNKIER